MTDLNLRLFIILITYTCFSIQTTYGGITDSGQASPLLMCSAGSLLGATTVNLCPDETTVFIVMNDTIPDGGNYQIYFDDSAGGTGGQAGGFPLMDVNIPYTFNAGLNGVLATNMLNDLEGTWILTGQVIDEMGQLCDESDPLTVNFLAASDDLCNTGGVPPNDECVNATALSLGVQVAGTNVGGTASAAEADPMTGLGIMAVCNPPLGFTIENAVWYTFTVTNAGNHTIGFTGNQCPQSYAVYPAEDISCININDSTLDDEQAFCAALGGGGDSTIAVLDARTYYLIVDGAGGLSCDFNLEVFEGPICDIPENVAAVPNDTSAELSWESEDGIGFTIEWGATGFTQGTGTSITTSQNPYTLENLTPSTTYDFYIQADCGASGISEWLGPVTFTTSPPAPECNGEFYDAGGADNPYPSNADETYTICPDNTGDAVTIIFTFVDIESATAAGNDDTGCWDYLSVYDAENTSSGFLGDFCNTPGTGGTAMPLDAGSSFTATNASGCLTFTFSSDMSVQGGGWAAQVTCNPADPCPAPVAGTATNITDSSAELSWTAAFTLFNVEWGPTGFAPGTGTSIQETGNPYELSGLSAETTYDFYVCAICPDGMGGTIMSDCAGPFTFTSGVAPPSCTTGVFYDNGGLLNNYLNNSNDSITICPDNPNEVVSVTFTYVDIETAMGTGTQGGCWDFLSIYNGDNTANPLQETACGELDGDGSTPQDAASLLQAGDSFSSTDASGCLTFLFSSDATGQESGWEATINCMPAIECPSNLGLNTTTTNESATGANDGSINLSVNGDGTAPYTYEWSTGAIGQNLVNLSVGTYCVTVTDANGCTDETCATVGSSCADEWEYTATVNYESGANANDGTIELTPTGGVPPYTYSWSNGATSQNIINLSGGITYVVMVTDALGCVGVYEVFVGTDCPMSLNITASVTDMEYGLMNGAIDIFVNNGSPPFTYQWSNGATTEDVDGLTDGNYTVIITDAIGCTDTYFATIKGICPQNLYLTSSVINESMAGAGDGQIDLEVGAGTPPFDYYWNTGANTQDISGLTPGSYCVTVFDEINCMGTLCINVGEGCSGAIISNIDITEETSTGDSDGAIDISVFGGNPLYTYQWDNGSSNADIEGLTAGTYCVTVTDGLGCMESTCVVVDNFCPLSLGIVADVTHQSVFMVGDGAIDVTVNGGVAPYTFLWDNLQQTEDLQFLMDGEYCVKVTDAVGCIDNVCFTVEAGCPPNLIGIIDADNVTVSGDSDGAISLILTNGTPPYTYQWSNGEMVEDLTDLLVGTYTVTVTDAEGCVDIEEFQVGADDCPPTLITADSIGYGSIDLTVEAGAPPYTYQWSTGADTEDVSDLNQDRYFVTVTDAAGCITLANYDIDGPVGVDYIDVLDDIQLSPNPANNSTQLLLEFSRQVDVQVDIVNVVGQVMERHNYKNISRQNDTFDLSTYSEGIYFIHIQANGQHLTKRLLVIR